MKNPKDTNPLDVSWDYYNRIVDEYAEKIFNQHIKPWLIKKNAEFLAGNGSWYIGLIRNGKTIPQYEEDLPEYILKWLQMEVPGLRANDLGSLMPSFDPRKDERI